MRINNGRSHFYQWDLNQRITKDSLGVGDKVHFANAASTHALVVLAYEAPDGTIVADVPNVLLREAYPITAYRYIKQGVSEHTREVTTFKVQKRPRPADYIYTETEVHDFEQLLARKTTVTIDGEVIQSFAVDAYVADRLAELVNSAPETLDTIAELAKALGNDPDFAAKVLEMIGQKADSTTVAEALEGKEDKFTAEFFGENLFDTTADPSVNFDDFYGMVESQKTFGDFCPDLVDGDKVEIEVTFRSFDDLNGDGAPAQPTFSVGSVQFNRNDRTTATIGKEVKLTDTIYLYSGDDQAPDTGFLEMIWNGVTITVRCTAKMGLEEYLADLESRVGEGGGLPLAQLNEILDDRIGNIDTALDEVLALQEYYTGATFDEIHEYAEGVIAGGAE